MIRARRRLALALAPLGAAALLSLHACERLFPEHPRPGAGPAKSEPAPPAMAAVPGDHGDTPAVATRIRPGAPLTGSFETADDVDYFKVEVTTETLLYVSTDQGDPSHAAALISVEAPDGTSTIPSLDQLVDDLVAGTYHIKVQPDGAATTAGAGYALAVWLFEQQNETFDIQLRYLGDAPSDAQKRVFEQAAAFWERALAENERTIPAPMKSSADRCPDTPSHFGELVDDLLINVVLAELDGPEQTLAVGGYCIHRLRNGRPDLPVIAIIMFDTADIGRFEADGSLRELAIHEMAHALGFGMDLWRHRGYLRNPTVPNLGEEPIDPPPNTAFTGPQAVTEFKDAGGTFDAVPVENNTDKYGAGSLDSHWRESVFKDETMTATVGANALISRVTLASLEDLGYAVNYDVADPYRLPRPTSRLVRRAASGIAAATAVPVADDIYPEPPRPLDLRDELVEALSSR